LVIKKKKKSNQDITPTKRSKQDIMRIFYFFWFK